MDDRVGVSGNEALWEAWLRRGRPPRRLAHALFRGVLARLPGSPRCKLCSRPFGGSGKVLALLGFGASRKNPAFCGYCLERLPLGGAEVDVAVLFADVRGSTGLAERSTAAAFSALMNRFYAAATSSLLAYGALIDKLVGDEVVGLFIPGFCGPAYRGLAARAGVALLDAMGYGTSAGPWLALGIGVHAGQAFVGNVGAQGIADFTALGDTVNVAARLQAIARPGEMLLSEDVYLAVAESYPDLEPSTIALRGRAEPLRVRVMNRSAGSHAATGR